MSIRRSPRRDTFTPVDNRLINDRALDFAALGALVYLLSKPDDWTIRLPEVAERGGIGRDAVQSIMQRMHAAGYATLETGRAANGRISGGRSWAVSEARAEAPVAATVNRPRRQTDEPSDGRTVRRTNRQTDEPSDGKPGPIVKTEGLPKTENNKNPQTPGALSAAEPRNHPGQRPGNDGGNAATPNGQAQRARRTRAAVEAPSGDDGGPRWQPVAEAIMGAIGRPAPGRKLPSWLGNTVRTFGAAAADDPARALALVERWAKSNQLRQAVAGGYIRDHTLPAIAGAWIASMREAGAVPRASGAAVDQEARLAQRHAAPANWREVVYAPGGVRRAPALALPLLGLEPYAPVEAWPAWYRAIEGQGVAA